MMEPNLHSFMQKFHYILSTLQEIYTKNIISILILSLKSNCFDTSYLSKFCWKNENFREKKLQLLLGIQLITLYTVIYNKYLSFYP